MWTLDIERGDATVGPIYNLADTQGEILYTGSDWEAAVAIWQKSEAPWLEMRLREVSVYCANLPVVL